jgi:hypothetical protein
MAEVRGVLLNGWAKLLDERYGPDQVSVAKSKLSAEDRLLIPLIFLDSNWYPFTALHAMRKLTRTLATRDNKSLGLEIGRAMARQSFNGAYRMMLMKDPVSQVGKFSEITEFFFRDARTLETQMVSDHSCLVRYRYKAGAVPNRGLCQSLAGFWGEVLEMAGGSRVKAAHPKCVLDRADCCEFSFDWASRENK